MTKNFYLLLFAMPAWEIYCMLSYHAYFFLKQPEKT